MGGLWSSARRNNITAHYYIYMSCVCINFYMVLINYSSCNYGLYFSLYIYVLGVCTVCMLTIVLAVGILRFVENF